jgi:hypothetical protein
MWKVAGSVRVAPIINTVEECIEAWQKALDGAPGGEATIASFSYTRPIVGNNELHYRIRLAWRDFISTRSWGEFIKIASGLRVKADRNVETPDDWIDVKFGPGGIMEFRLSGFLDRLFAARKLAPRRGASVWSAYNYLMHVRDCTFQLNRSHVIMMDHQTKLADLMNIQRSECLSAVNILSHIMDCRIAIHRHFSQLVAELDRHIIT